MPLPSNQAAGARCTDRLCARSCCCPLLPQVCPSSSLPVPRRAQAFAAPDRVAELVGRVREALGAALPEAVASMRLYLPNPATHAILFKPIKSNVAEAHGQVSRLLSTCAFGRIFAAQLPIRLAVVDWSGLLRGALQRLNKRPCPECDHPQPCPMQAQIAALLEAEYTAEEVAAIGLTPPAELAALLDGLS